MVNCPICGKEAEPTGKEFKFGVFNGKQFYCKNDEKPFNAFYRGEKFSHTVPKPK